MVEKRNRIWIGLGIIFILAIGAMTTLSSDLELTGVLFITLSMMSIFYLLFSGLILRNKPKDVTFSWINREILVLTALILFFSIIGFIESISQSDSTTVTSNNYPIFIVFFAELSIILSAFIFINYTKSEAGRSKLNIRKLKYPRKLYWILAILNGFTLIIFNDYWGENELFLIFVFFYFPILLFFIVRWAFREIKEILNLKNEKAKTELIHLQSQVNPHFFFNMLNSLYGWTGKDPKKAQELILQLSDIMRYSIYEGQKEFVTLAEEADYLEKYMALHTSRYLKEISIEFNTEIQNEALKITPLLFIILVENAFKHGVESLRENAFIKINILTEGTLVKFNIENNFDTEKPLADSGIGIKNLKRRLELVYEDQHDFTFEKNGDIFQAQLTIELS